MELLNRPDDENVPERNCEGFMRFTESFYGQSVWRKSKVTERRNIFQMKSNRGKSPPQGSEEPELCFLFRTNWKQFFMKVVESGEQTDQSLL